MSIQYLSDNEGQIVAVQVPIDEWRLIRSRHPDIESDMPVPDWQKQLVKERLEVIKNNPDSVHSIDGLLRELGDDKSQA